MGTDREYRIRIQTVADGTGAKESAKDLDKLGEKTGEASKHAEHAQGTHRALHMILGQLGETSKTAEIGMAALAGVMMGSMSFGAMAVVQRVRMVIDHFAQLKAKALEVSKATVEMWQDMVKSGTDAREVLENYNEALEKIITNVDTLKKKESEESAVLKMALELRLKILDAERQAEIAKARGDKEEEARVNARYGRRKSETEFENEAAEIALKERHLGEQISEGAKRQSAADAAAAAKATGAPGREEANAAEAGLPKLEEELVKLQAARMKPADLAALKTWVAKDAELLKNGDPSILAMGALGIPQAKVAQLKKANEAEQAYNAAQQEYEQAQADIKHYKDGTKKLADAVEHATEALGKIVEEARATEAEISKAKAVHGVNVDAAATIKGVQDKAEIEMAGGRYNPASRKVMEEVRAMAATADGQRMSGQDTAYFNNLLAAARDAHKEDMAKAVIAELKSLHVDEAKKWEDLSRAISEIRQGQGREFHTLPGNQ
jgi:hypothetical protein